MQQLEQAIVGLEQVLTNPPSTTWNQVVRQRVHSVHEALRAERTGTGESWLSPRSARLRHERDRLIGRLGALSARVPEQGDQEVIRQDLLRLVHDIQHHHQRVNDLAYDAVAADLGGSE